MNDEIKAYAPEHSGLKVGSLYIAPVKQALRYFTMIQV